MMKLGAVVGVPDRGQRLGTQLTGVGGHRTISFHEVEVVAKTGGATSQTEQHRNDE
jgi:hypothetical protein